MNKAMFKVLSIRNNTEKQQIKNALDKIEGVQEVDINQAESLVNVGYNEPSTEEEIINCISNTVSSVKKL